MKRPLNLQHLWASLLIVFLLIGTFGTSSARAHGLLSFLISLVASDPDPSDPSVAEPSPLDPLVNVGGPSTAGPVQLTDSTAQYQKTDVVIQTSAGPFSFMRTFSTRAWFQPRPNANEVPLRQWWNNLTGSVAHNLEGELCSGALGGQTPSCVRLADYIVFDPDTGALLTYFNQGGLGAPPTTGFQIPENAAETAKLYITATNGVIHSYILFKANAHYYFTSQTNFYLSRIETTRYGSSGGVALATISYSSPGVISTVTTADGVQLAFASDAGALQSISVVGGGVVATYQYSGAFVTEVQYPETGTGEQYGYGTNFDSFVVTTLAGRPVISFSVDAGKPPAGNGWVTSEHTEDATLSFAPSWSNPQSPCVNGPLLCGKTSVTDSTTTAGNGNLSTSPVTKTYTISSYGPVPQTPTAQAGTGPQTSALLESCSVCSGPGATWEFTAGTNGVNPGEGLGVPPIAQLSINERGFSTVYTDGRLAPSSAVPTGLGFYSPVEYPTVVTGANDAGTQGLSSTVRTYVYGGAGQSVRGYEQLIATAQQPSPLGGTAQTNYSWDAGSNELNAVVHSGKTVVDSSFAQVTKSIGTIYSYDNLGRITQAIGPCFVSGANPTACASGSAPAVVYRYWPTSTAFTSNRLSAKIVCNSAVVNGTCTGLTTEYNTYDARGHVLESQAPDGTVTTSTYNGDQIATRSVRSSFNSQGPVDTTTYGYDEDQLLWVQHPSGMVDFTCHRVQPVGTPPGYCPTNGGLKLSAHVYWKAKCTSTSCAKMTESVAYEYKHGFVSKETYYDANLQIRRIVRHDRDPRNKPTFDAVGDTDNAHITAGSFDMQGNQTAIGFPYNSPAPLCNYGTGPQNCAKMTFDPLDRLTALAEPPTTVGTAEMTATYDSLGHISTIGYGCSGSPPGNCSIVKYVYDDFGNLITVQAPWLESGSSLGTIDYAYDAQGHIVAKHTPAMATGEYLQYDYDTLGRVLDLKHFPANELLWALDYDSTNSSCPVLSSVFTTGRVQVRHDSFGQTWYIYDFRGQILGEMRVRTGALCEPFPTAFPSSTPTCQQSNDEAHLNTLYSYAGPGVLSVMQYPHGRTVRLGYPSAGTGDVEEVSSISADVLTASGCLSTTLVSNITWEPYGALRGYQVNSPTSAGVAAAIEYLLGDNSSLATMTSCPSGARPSATGSDHSGRLRALWVSTGSFTPSNPTGTGDIFARQFTWQGDQVTAQATCLLQTGGQALVENFFSSSGEPGYDARLQLQHVSRPAGGMKATGGSFGLRDYLYDLRGNRTDESTDCWKWSDSASTTFPDQLASRVLTGNVCSGTCPTGSSFQSTSYGYDADGRMLALTSPPNSSGAPTIDIAFVAGLDSEHAALGSVYRQIIINGAAYEYFYDAVGRRRLKQYPLNELADEYFYNPGNELLEDHEGASLSAQGVVQPAAQPTTLDEYVWLGRLPVILFRGSLASSGTRNVDFAGTCADMGPCGVYFPVSDHLGKPVVLLNGSLKVAGAADYDPFGHVNRVIGVGDTQHPYSAAPLAQVVAGFRQSIPVGAAYSLIARARLAMVDTDSNAFASLTDLQASPLIKYPVNGSNPVGNVSGAALGVTATDWGIVPASTAPFPGQFQVRFTASTASSTNPRRSGVSVVGYEYRKFQTGVSPTWLPIRLPGQYYDAETDLFQNWNRFYDATTGRYLEPEPLWLNPEELLALASKGRFTPVYAYAGNNPLNAIDFDGNLGVLVDGLSVDDSGFYGSADNLSDYCSEGSSKCKVMPEQQFFTHEADAIVAADAKLRSLLASGQLSKEAAIRIMKLLTDGGDPRIILLGVKMASDKDPHHMGWTEAILQATLAIVHIHVAPDKDVPSEEDPGFARQYGYDMGVRTFNTDGKTNTRLILYTPNGVPEINGGKPGFYQYYSSTHSWGFTSPTVDFGNLGNTGFR